MALSDEIKILVSAEVGKAVTEIKKLQAQIDSADKTTKKTNDSFSALGKSTLSLAAVMGTLYTAYKYLIKPASDLNEQHNAFSVSFKNNMKDAESWASTLVNSYAMSTREAEQYLTSVNGLLKPMLGQEQLAANLSNQVVKLAADLGSFKNLPTADVLADINSAIVGQVEPVRKYGVVLNEAVIKNEAFAMGLYKGQGAIDASARAQASLNLIFKATTDAQGDMIMTSDSFANVQKAVMARIEDTGAAIGSILLPALGALGKSFLRTSGEGNILTEYFKFLAKMISQAIKGIAAIIEAFNYLTISAKKALSDLADEEYNLNDSQKKTTAEAINFAKAHGVSTGNVINDLKQIIATNKNLSSQELTNAKLMINALTYQEQRRKELNKSQEGYNKSLDASADAIMRNISLDDQQTNKAVTNRDTLAMKFVDTQNKMTEEQKKAHEQAMNNMATYNEYVGQKVEAELVQEQLKYEQLLQLYSDHADMKAEIEAAHQEKMKTIEVTAAAAKAQQIVQYTQQASQMIMNIVNQEQKNRETKVNNRYTKEKALIGMAITDEQTRTDAMALLDLQYEQKRRKMKRESAVKEKAFAIIQAVINTAVGVTSALQAGFPLGIIMAALYAAMGAVQIGLIAAAPIPAAAEGALVKGSSTGTMIKAGEGGRSEMIIPFENEEVMSRVGAGSGGGPGVSIQVQELYAVGDATSLAVDIDRALFKLWQDKRSLFANAMAGA